jgi:hypothetical protein
LKHLAFPRIAIAQAARQGSQASAPSRAVLSG